MPHGQEKSGNQEKLGNTKKSDKSKEKSGKNSGFWNKAGKIRKNILKKSDLVSSNLIIPYI